MSDDSPKDQPTAESAVQGKPASEIPSQPVQEVAPSTVVPTDRRELLTHARSFLTSPQAQLQSTDAKRTFLAEKGLTFYEIDQLLRESPPIVPPRTYPLPPPSNLPNLLSGVARIFSWLTGTSAVVLFIYYRYLLPRLTQSYQARLALRRHQSTLITRLTESVSALKTSQTESYKDLPRTTPIYEGSPYTEYHSIDDILSHAASSREESTQPGADIPDITILRCALTELGRSRSDGIATEELFSFLEGKLPWLGCEEGTARQSNLWDKLNSCPLFVSSMPRRDLSNPLPVDQSSQLLWKYVPPQLPPTPPLLVSLAKLLAALPRGQELPATGSSAPLPASTISARQRTLQVLSDFTGYITTQIYSLGLPSIRGTNGVPSGGSPLEEELRRDIRALKGLVLNRRSFLSFNAGSGSSQ